MCIYVLHNKVPFEKKYSHLFWSGAAKVEEERKEKKVDNNERRRKKRKKKEEWKI